MKPPDSAPTTVHDEGRDPLHLTDSVPAEGQPLRSIQWAQALVIVALYSFPVFLCLHVANAADLDVWWHLRAGEWIMQHGAVPHTDPFSVFGAGKPWFAYSWLFELIIFQLFRWLGLVGLVVYTTGMVVSIAVVLHRLVRRLQADFTLAVLLTLVAALSIYRLYTPRPWLFSILLFVLELDVLMQARKTGKIRELVWLPVIFALWANVHIQFIDGLILLTIALTESLLARRWSAIQTRLRPGWICAVSLACVLATLVNPYGWRIYQVAYDLATQTGVLNKITELSAMPFRSLNDWCVLVLVLAAVSVLAQARRFLFFESTLLAFAIYVSFHSQRDVWVVVVAASAILALGITGNSENRLRLKAIYAPLVAAATCLVVWLAFSLLAVNNARMRVRLAEAMPVRAVEAVKAKGWSGPLYNDFNWGGYLIWALRMPVAVDGRQNVYGDDRLNRSYATWNAQPSWASDPDLQKANLVIAQVNQPLTQLLRMDPHFEVGYEDKLAVVFIARESSKSKTAEGSSTPVCPTDAR
ncbi:MAG: hypothetical protein ABSE55_05055 [Terracidiphilus sp.]|jgi:hypothetical protein